MLQDPVNHLAHAALKEVWLSAIEMGRDVRAKQAPIQVWTTPTEMSIQQVSVELYGDGNHIEDLNDLNGFADQFAIPAGTDVRYYRAA